MNIKQLQEIKEWKKYYEEASIIDYEDGFVFNIEDTKWSLIEVIDKLKEDNLFNDLMKQYS
jgi:hypothetical protein